MNLSNVIMLSTNVRVRTNRNTSDALQRATDRYALDGAQKGFNVSQERVPHGATSFLANQSAVEPTRLEDGTVVWGYNAEYAEDVEEGTPPHIAPIDAIRKWARRVLGSEGAAGAVWRKIARVGTEAQPYVEPGVKAMREWFGATSPGDYLREELGR